MKVNSEIVVQEVVKTMFDLGVIAVDKYEQHPTQIVHAMMTAMIHFSVGMFANPYSVFTSFSDFIDSDEFTKELERLITLKDSLNEQH